MTVHKLADFLTESQGLKVGGADSFVAYTADILRASADVHADLFGGIQRNDLANVMQQRCNHQFITSTCQVVLDS